MTNRLAPRLAALAIAAAVTFGMVDAIALNAGPAHTVRTAQTATTHAG